MKTTPKELGLRIVVALAVTSGVSIYSALVRYELSKAPLTAAPVSTESTPIVRSSELSSPSSLSSNTALSQPSTSAKNVRVNVKYTDGQYSATGSYVTPDGQESIQVNVTVKNDTIVDASVAPLSRSSTSWQYQEIFAQNFQPYVVGKPIDSVSLNWVSGASLTPRGFNEALSQIKAQAAD